MYHLNIPLLYVFIAFTVGSGLIMFYCGMVIHKSWKRLAKSDLHVNEQIRSKFVIIIIVIPFLGFGFEFIYFLYKTVQELLLLV